MSNKNKEQDLTRPAAVNLAGSASPADMAQREGWDPTRYAVVLAENVRRTDVPLDAQRERLAALAGCGALADQAAADALAQHYAVLEALHHRFTLEAFKALDSGNPKSADVADRYLAAALKAQRAAMAVLSALKVLRDAPPSPSTAPTTPMPPPPATVTEAGQPK